ncbi:hypothetical protein H7I76_00225 [Mycolicibacterium vaccae]|nr:hypothetical protein [Mycolicibacterium vaccae]
MTVRITLTDEELPPSGDFIAFLRQWISGAPFDGTSWARDGHARAIRAGTGASRQQVLRDVSALVESDEGSRHLTRAYELFVALLVGDSDALAAIHDRFRFILVVGIPRSGGKYLTKQLFRALGHDPNTVPEVLGHDAYPDAGPWRFGEGLGSVSRNGWTTSLQTTAEYLTMVELFFGAGAGARAERALRRRPEQGDEGSLRGRSVPLGVRREHRGRGHRAPPGTGMCVDLRSLRRLPAGRALRRAPQHRKILCP